MSKQQSVIRLMLVDDKIDDAEQSISLLRNGGIPVRPSRPETLAELEAALTNASGEIILASYAARTIPFKAVAEAAQASGKDVVVIALLDQLDEASVNEVLASGARGFALRGRAKFLQFVIGREARISERRRLVRRLEASLRETERRCDALIASSRDPIAYVHEGMHIRANQAYLEMFGYESFEEIEGLPLLDMVGPENADQFKQLLKDLSRGEPPPKNLELKARRADGETFDALMEFAQASYEGEPCIQIVMRPQLMDAEMVKELDALRQRDQITGLYNRQHFLGELDVAISAAAEGASDQALLLMELDNYATLMNAVGVANADALLKATAERIARQLPENAITARFTEHGIAVLLRGSNHNQTRDLAKVLCKSFENAILEVGDHSLNATLSIGGVQIGQKIASAQQVLNKVVSQIQSAQAEGGNRALIFDPAARDRAEEERIAQWVAHMESALKGEGFVLFFQPIIHLTGEPEETFQVLLRLTGPNGDIVTPGVFMGIAEEHGMMARIDRWVIQRAIAAIAQRHRSGRNTRLFVKVTVESLQDPKLAAWIAANLKQANVPPENLVISLPESKAFTNLKAVQELHASLSRLGCGMCLEQFGLGLNSFQLLSHVPADYLGIDHSLIEDLARNPESQAKVREITDRAAELGRKTIAEGAQDAGSMTVLFTSNVQYVYGNFLAPPEHDMSFDFNQ
ncbi:bifunctional diguanylate cyclase/phosphodiesterase [Denitratimonas tolerans]|jgi:diguanylate cyclase (GGDEF)-like protein/PAS domain S-box-containing protein|uniref:Bifunctional diguanylate cyclase/phosphodiesterase n=1 Tax=Denitratimonas tolerans TaxID=1338420 RepID=A0AAW9R0D4_9GAMM|nr:bifunctional diguanylate cyclase/phosphodiesterase [Xanthomonadaceae bacterium]